MRRSFTIMISTFILLTGCSPAEPIATPETISVQYTSAASPWLAGVYECAGENVVSAEERVADFQNPQSFNLSLRIGQPANLTSPAYQIGSEEILVIVNPQNPVKVLNAEQVRGLFSGQTINWQKVGGSNGGVQVWVFSSGEDVQQVFETETMDGTPVASTARLATDPDEMAKAISSDVNSVGILTRRWKAGNVTDVFPAATVPVLALAKDDPQTGIKDLIACLQNNTQ